MINKNKYSILSYIVIILFLLNISLSFADGMNVNANFPSGSYNHVLKVELTPTLDNTKTFYSFNPDGGPNDAFLYTGAIILKSSTSLIFFSFLNTQIESKIKQNDYIIKYPNTISLSSSSEINNLDKINGIFIVNNDNSSIDISYWEIKKDDVDFIIPDGTILNPNQTFSINGIFSGTGFISFFSPDGEKKDFLEIVEIENIPETIEQVKILQTKKIYKKKIIENNILSNSIPEGSNNLGVKSESGAETKPSVYENINNSGSEDKDTLDISKDDLGKKENILSTTNQNKSDSNDGNNDINNNLKLSLNETKANSNTIIIFTMIGGLFIFGVFYQIFQKRKS